MMKILVTGATGFLGFRLIQALKEQGHFVIATGRNPAMAEKIRHLGIAFEAGSVENADFVAGISQGVEAVIHTAGLSSPWGKYADFYAANVQGTESVIAACKQNQIRRLVHVSTPSIYVEYRDREDVKESDPLPSKFANAYATTKFLAEERVRAAAQEGLETIMIRPRALIGAGDTVILPRLLRAHKEGRLRIIGKGQNRVDLTAVSNVVDALILCLNAPTEALGEAYNITNGEPVKLWEFLQSAFERLGLTLDTRHLPYHLAFSLAAALESAATLDPAYKEPPLTRYTVCMLAKSQTLNIDKARTRLGYQPRQSLLDATTEFITWWKQSNWL
jgi:nucleoside-diphosphate-sugar epimerase